MSLQPKTLLVPAALLIAIALGLLAVRGGGNADRPLTDGSTGPRPGARHERPAEPMATPAAGRTERVVTPGEGPDPGRADEPAAPPRPEVPRPADPVESEPAPGTLRIVARSSGQPLDGRTVIVSRTRSYWLPAEVDTTAADTNRYVLDRNGRVDVSSLQEGNYIVALEFRPRQVHQVRIKLGRTFGRTVVFDLSGGSMHGLVFDTGSQLADGACVSLTQRGKAHDETLTMLTWTDFDGAYRIDGVSAGSYHVSAHLDGSMYSDAEYSMGVSFASGEAKRLDLGATAEWATWTGTLRNAAGDAIGWSGRRRPEITVRSVASKRTVSVTPQPDGTFELRVELGVHRVVMRAPGMQNPAELEAPLEIASTPFVRDLVIPGTTVRGVVYAADSGEPVVYTGTGRKPSVRAHEEGRTHPAAFVSATVGEDGAYAIHGLTPGRWRVGVGSEGLDKMVDVVIHQGDTEVVLDLSAGT